VPPTDADFQAAIAHFREAASVVLTTHVAPDADGLGSVSALVRWLRRRGKRAEVVLPTVPPEKYAFLADEETFRVAGRDVDPAALTGVDLVAVLDTSTWPQLEGVEPLLKDLGAPVLVIDHHRTHNHLADVEIIDPEAPATAMLVHRLLVLAGAEIDAATASDLLVGLVGDTDWFRLPNVTPEVLHLAGDLVAAGARPWDLYARLNLTDALPKLHLWGRALETLHTALDGQVAVLHVTGEMFRQAEADPADTEGLINVALRIRGVRVAVMLTEAEDGEVRISLRSVPGVDVLGVAERFGGGGHDRASGARAHGSLQEVESAVLDAVAEALAQAAPAPADEAGAPSPEGPAENP